MKFRVYTGFSYLKHELSPIFRMQYLREDITAGIIVACVSIPLSMAIAMASGVSPAVGLVSAIFGGILAAIFGGTRLAVTGPAAAMAVIIAYAIEQNGVAGLLVIGIICGILQILFGILRLGRYARFVPLPVVAAFTAGIGFIILVGQLPRAFQLSLPEQRQIIDIVKYIWSNISNINLTAFILAILTLVVVKIVPRFSAKAPAALVAVLVTTLIVYFTNLRDIQLLGDLEYSLAMPKLPDFSAVKDWSGLIQSAIAVFALASLETLLSSSAVDNMGTGDIHNSNQELIGQGIANTGVALFGGIPVTGVIARSSVNIAAGAKTRRSPIIHSLVIVLAIYLFPNLIGMIPFAALVGVIIGETLNMINFRGFINSWRTDRLESLVYLFTFIAIILTDIISGVQAGVAVAVLIVAVKMLRTKANIHLWANKSLLRIGFSGGISFWSFERLAKLQDYILEHPDLRFVIFEFNELTGLDSSGATHILDTAKIISNNGIGVIFHGLNTNHQDLMFSCSYDGIPYSLTFTEDEIKTLLERSGVQHSVQDVLLQGMQKSLINFAHDRKELLTKLSQGQNPHTLLITCSDSRLNPNAFLSAGLGELFIVRNVGNVVPRYHEIESQCSEAAAIEFAINVLKIRNVVICAHTDCGAVKAVISNEKVEEGMDNLNNWLNNIRKALKDKQINDLNDGIKFNLLCQLDNLTTYPVIKKLIIQNKIEISAWLYDVHKADVLSWDNDLQQLVSLLKKPSN